MPLFPGLRNISIGKLIMIFLTINFLFLAIQGGLSNYYYQTNRLLNEEILNLTHQVQRQSDLEELKIRLLLNTSIAELIRKIDITTQANLNLSKQLQQQNIYFFKAAATQDKFRSNVTSNMQNVQRDINEIIANQQVLFTRLAFIAGNKTLNQTLDTVLRHEHELAKLLLFANRTR